MKVKFTINDLISIGEEKKDNKITYYVINDGKQTKLYSFNVKDDRDHGVCYFKDYIFAWSNGKYESSLSIDAIYDVNKKRKISLNPEDANKYKYVFIYVKSFSLRDVLMLINKWDYDYGKTDGLIEMIDYLTGGDKEISRECIIDYVYRCYPRLREYGSYKEPISALKYTFIACELGTDSIKFHMMPEVITDKNNDNLIDSMDRYIAELKKLKKKDPEEAKKIAKEGLIRMGIINENGEQLNPDDYTRGPKLSRRKND